MADQLVEIPSAEWPKLRDMYRRDWPDNMIGFYTVDTFLRWLDTAPISDLAIFSLNGDWTNDGTFVCVHRIQVFANTLSTSVDRLRSAMRLIEWKSNSYIVSTLRESFRPAILDIIEEQQLGVEFDINSLMYYMPGEKAHQLDISCPPGITLKSLRPEHAQQIDDVWPNRYPGSQSFIKLIIERSPSVGAFDEDDELVAWCLRLQAGPHGAMQVRDTHKRRGLGLLVCKALTRELGELGMDSTACVFPDNTASIATFQKVGFHVTANVFWIRIGARTTKSQLVD